MIDEALGVEVVAEPPWVRVRHGAKSALYPERDPERFLAALREGFAAVRFADDADVVAVRFADDIDVRGEPAFDADERRALRVDVALHWLRYFASVREPARITAGELAHPQSWDIVLAAARAKCGGDPAAFALAARLLGVLPEDVARWRRVEDDRLANM